VSSPNSKPSTENILSVVEKYKNYEFDNKMISWFTSSLDALKCVTKKEVFCSELLAMTFQDLDMMKTKESGGQIPSFYSPGSFDNNNIEGMYSSFSFGNRKFLDFSSVCNKPEK
jgi:hypothetical protein